MLFRNPIRGSGNFEIKRTRRFKKVGGLFFLTVANGKKTLLLSDQRRAFFCVNGYHLIRKNYNSLLITHILDGNFTYVKNGKHTTAHKGDTVILDCYNPHEYYTENGFESIWIHVSGSNSYELFEEIEKNNGTLIKCKDIHYVEKLLFRIYDSIKGDTPPSELRISVDIYKLFAELLNFQTTKSLGENNYEDTVQQIKEYISDHLSENLTVNELAMAAHMSASHFSRIFKQQTGFSPYDYVLIFRLNRAKFLLKNTDLSVSTVAYKTGFNSESNFIYFFTENVGISPGKFRKLKF